VIAGIGRLPVKEFAVSTVVSCPWLRLDISAIANAMKAGALIAIVFQRGI
jgi:hypothetical protein